MRAEWSVLEIILDTESLTLPFLNQLDKYGVLESVLME
jgi:hypothetical protein